MRGLQFPKDLRFESVWEALHPEISDLYWLIDCAGGPFYITELPDPEYDAAEADLARLFVAVDEFESTSTALYRPQIFPSFAGRLVEDDWSRVYGFKGPEANAVQAALRCDLLTPTFEAKCLLVRPEHGAWQVFSEAQGLLALARRVAISEVDWNA